MKTPNVFKRREIKYLITDLQKKALMRFVLQNMHPDEFGKSTIRNVYLTLPISSLFQIRLNIRCIKKN